MRLILKTMVSNVYEIPFMWMMFEEAASHVDKIVVTEFNQTHSGLSRDFIFDEHVEAFQVRFPQLEYLQGRDLDGVIRDADTADEHHHNETLMRGWFARQLKFRNSDIIVSTDADEVLYSSTYEWVKRHLTWRSEGVKFRLHQFFYRPNYLWVGKEFVAPVALRYGAFNDKYPNDWRYQGKKLPGFWGAHFSWCIPVTEMARKVKNYSHAAEHRHLDSEQLFIEARNNGTFPFDERDFRLQEISQESKLIPASFHTYAHLLDPDVWASPGG